MDNPSPDILSPLSEEQVEHFYREGFVVAPRLVPEAAMESVLSHAQGQYQAGGVWSPRIFEHGEPSRDAGLHSLLFEPHVVGAARQILASEPRIYYGMLAVVPARGGQGLPWHQDNQYTTILGGALNVFIALCDISSDKAILHVAPRSHLSGTQPSKEAGGALGAHRTAVVEPTNGRPLPPMKKGDVAIFDRNLYHRSLKNETDEDRYAYAAQFQADFARQAESGKRDPLRMRAIDLPAMIK